MQVFVLYLSRNPSRPRMLTHSEIPKLLKRTHIVKGYRPLNQPITYYCKSAFCTHNELHSRSPHDHIFWFLVDFAGIALFGCSIGLQRYSCGSDMSLIGHMAYLPSLMLIVLVLQFLSSCYLFVSQPEWPWRLELRMATCFLLAIWVYVPLVDRYLSENSAADSSLVLHTNAFNWLMVSGVFMGAKVPERFAPGKFDIFGYGHQLFHLCVNMVAWNLCDAAHLDCAPIAWNSPSNVAISAAFLMSAVFTACTVRTLSKKSLDIKYD
ncbi:hypothetical protein GCK32_016799 [Trichostrongylus colubriformis]|uniref:Uncharacterized protein n=1 Tax=Trichostrongylus colubriformis TaxID=6319 RepID=A0AAN8IK84_TRICO